METQNTNTHSADTEKGKCKTQRALLENPLNYHQYLIQIVC